MAEVSCFEKMVSLIRLTEEDASTRWEIIEAIEVALQKSNAFKGCIVTAYGSFPCGLSTCQGDLDLSIDGQTLIGLDESALFEELLGLFRERDEVSDLKLKTGKIPIVLKFNYQEVAVDLTIANLPSCARSKFLERIYSTDDRLPQLVLLLKEWVEKEELVGKGVHGGLNSYSLYLMTIFHCQTLTPPLLLPLKNFYEGNILEEQSTDWSKILLASKTSNFVGQSEANTCSLSELLISFVDKFEQMKTMAETHYMSTYTGKWEVRNTHSWWNNSDLLVVEDPFDLKNNVTKRVTLEYLRKLEHVFIQAKETILRANGDQNMLLPKFFREDLVKEFYSRS